MTELKKGMLARSLAGHDKGKWYVILDTDERNVFLTDGYLRPVQKPKKKNRVHIQPCYVESGVFAGSVPEHPEKMNTAIRKAIKTREDK